MYNSCAFTIELELILWVVQIDQNYKISHNNNNNNNNSLIIRMDMLSVQRIGVQLGESTDLIN